MGIGMLRRHHPRRNALRLAEEAKAADANAAPEKIAELTKALDEARAEADAARAQAESFKAAAVAGEKALHERHATELETARAKIAELTKALDEATAPPKAESSEDPEPETGGGKRRGKK